MKKRGLLIVSMLAILVMMTTVLAGCGSSGTNSKGDKVDGAEQEAFVMKNADGDELWNIQITGYEVKWDETWSVDCILVYISAENLSDDERVFENDVIVTTEQGDDGVFPSHEFEKNTGSTKAIKKGETLKATYAFQLNNYKDITIGFKGYNEEDTTKDFTLNIEDMQSDEAKDSAN